MPPPVRVKLQRGSARGDSRQLGGGCGQLVSDGRIGMSFKNLLFQTNDDKSESLVLWLELDSLSALQALMNPDMLLFSVFN